MNPLNAYRCRDGNFLISPECMQASVHEAHAHGPLQFVCIIDCSDFPPRVCGDIERQLDERMYALVAASVFAKAATAMELRLTMEESAGPARHAARP